MSHSSSMKSSEESIPVSGMNESISKSIFESLNMEMDEGKPRFRLNEPTYSTVNMKCQNNVPCEDDDDDISFVVLGKSSLDSINLASLANYEQIQQKSMNVDCNSIISTLSNEQIESKVSELLQENIKLKETLTQNNSAMKQHFNTLIAWQNELIKVHGSHKQKFVETCDMISFLKKENAELKEKLSTTESLMASQFSGETTENKFINGSSVETYLDADNKDNSTPMNSITTDVIESKESSCNCSDTTKCLKLYERQERDMHYQQEIILSLKEQLHKLSENSFLSLQLQMENLLDRPPDKNRQQFFEHYTYYNGKLNDLAKCYAEQASRFIDIQDCLKRCIDSLEIHRDNQKLNSPGIVEETEKTLKACRKQLIQEQLLNIAERQNLIKTQNQFQKIFSDYNSALHELEILREESAKPSQKDYELEKEKQELYKKLDELENERKQIELEHKNINAERLLFQLEQESLNDEKASLDSQSLIYEAQIKNYNDNLKDLETRHEYITIENETLKVQLADKNIELEGLRARIQLAENDAETISHFRQQLEFYESDFQEERKRRQELIQEREQLTEQLAKLRNHNQNLLRKINGPNPAGIPQGSMDQILADAFCTECGLYKMPGKWHGPGFCQPTD